MEIFTDGSCIGSLDEGRFSGAGIWFGRDDNRNTSIPIHILKPTNQHAELLAIRYALVYCRDVDSLIIKTDSQYSINCLTVWARTWEQNNWMTSQHKPVLHDTIIKESLEVIRYRNSRGYATSIIYVKAHVNIPGNEGADTLAKAGACKARDSVKK